MRHVQALLNWILLSTGRTDLKRLVVVVVVQGGSKKNVPPEIIQFLYNQWRIFYQNFRFYCGQNLPITVVIVTSYVLR